MLWSIIKKIVLISMILATAGCSSHKGKNYIIVGTISGPETSLMEVAKKVAEKRYHLDVKIVEFSDYNLPNQALFDGSIDVNAFQHQPYLNSAIQQKHYNFVAVAKTFLFPMGIYSQKIKHLDDLPNNAIVAIPNDPSNEARALLLLEKAKLITLKPNTSLGALPIDIESNPKHLKFKELDAAELPRALSDVDIALINTNFATVAGLNPTKNAIYLEGKDSLFDNLIVARDDNKNSPNVLLLINAYQSPEVLNAAKKIFKGAAIPAW